MKKTMSRDITVGVVVLLAAFIFTIAIFSIGSEQRLWVEKVTYKIRVPEANGLQSGSPVRLAGVQVGTVTKVDFSPDPNVQMIEVDLAINKAHQHRIREDSTASVRILTLLGGEKYVELSPGVPTVPVLPPGSFIPVPESFDIEQLGELSAGLADDLTSISTNIRQILEGVQTQKGFIGRMLLDPNFGKAMFEDIGESARLTRNTLERINSGEGMVGRLLVDDEFAREAVTSIRHSLHRIEGLLDDMTAEDGVLKKAMGPAGPMVSAIDNIYQASKDMKDFTSQVSEGNGTLGRLINDREFADELLGNVRTISKNLAEISEKLNKGQGTLGALINDPQLHQDLINVLHGVQKSKVMSWLIRHYRKKGEKAAAKEERRKNEEKGEEGKSPEKPAGGGL